MKSIYIVRLDDAHPGQLNENWSQVEQLLDELNIKPIVAIIPQNQDMAIDHGEGCEAAFWEKARNWQSKGWGIAVHGLHHLLEKGHRSILPTAVYSEFSGKPFEEQLSMLVKAVGILSSRGCVPEYFVAPAHGFDEQTLAALKHLDPPLIVADGLGFRPFIKDGVKFIPQQLWRGRWFPFGVWSICLHPSTLSKTGFIEFADFARQNQSNFMTSHHSLKFRQRTALDQVFDLMYCVIYRIKNRLKRLAERPAEDGRTC